MGRWKWCSCQVSFSSLIQDVCWSSYWRFLCLLFPYGKSESVYVKCWVLPGMAITVSMMALTHRTVAVYCGCIVLVCHLDYSWLKCFGKVGDEEVRWQCWLCMLQGSGLWQHRWDQGRSKDWDHLWLMVIAMLSWSKLLIKCGCILTP